MIYNITLHIVFDTPVSTIHLWLCRLLREAILWSAPTSCCNAVSKAEKSCFTAWRGKIVAWWKRSGPCWWDIAGPPSQSYLCRRWKLRFCYHLCSIYDAPVGLCCIPGWGNKMDLFSTSRSRDLLSSFERVSGLTKSWETMRDTQKTITLSCTSFSGYRPCLYANFYPVAAADCCGVGISYF